MPVEAQASLELQNSEAVAVNAASRIFAAYIAAGHVTPENQRELIEYAVRAATEIAVRVDRFVQSDDESLGRSSVSKTV